MALLKLVCMCVVVLLYTHSIEEEEDGMIVLCAKDDSALSCGFEPKRGSSRIVKHKVKVRYPSFFLVHGDMVHAGSRVLWCGYEAYSMYQLVLECTTLD